MSGEVVLKGGKEAVKDDEEALKGDGMTTGRPSMERQWTCVKGQLRGIKG